jgi:glycosyltransferase involved in cell wall biosynthesis
MRIAILTELFFPHIGGTEVRLYEIGRRLVARGHDVDAFTIRHSLQVPKEEQMNGIHVHRYGYSPSYFTPNGLRSCTGVLWYSLITAFKSIGTNYDLYYFGQWPLLHGLLTKPLVSPCVLEWCEVWRRRIVLLEKTLGRLIANHVAVSEFTKHRMTEFLNLSPQRITVIPNGVDLSQFSDHTTTRTWGRLVYVGRLAPHKGLDDLLEAFRVVKEKNSQVELFIAGSGTSLSSLREHARGLDGAHIVGQLTEAEKVDLLKSSWLFVMPSAREGFGIAPLEAMAAGTPVLTVDHPDNGLKAICKHGNGIVTPPNAASIAAAVSELLSNEEEWNAMSKASLRFAEEHDWENIVDQTEAYFNSIVNNGQAFF